MVTTLIDKENTSLHSNIDVIQLILDGIHDAKPISDRNATLANWDTAWRDFGSGIPNYFNGCCRVHGEWRHDPGLERKLLDDLLTHLHVRYLQDIVEIDEIGCGNGINLALLSSLSRNHRLRGFDWSQSAVDAVRARGFAAERFDMFYPPDMRLRGAVLTVHSMEQLGEDWEAMLDFLRRSRPSIVVHVEPILELYNEMYLIDYLHAQYHRKRGYLTGYLPELRRLHDAGKIELLQVERSSFSGLMHDAYSVVVWRPN